MDHTVGSSTRLLLKHSPVSGTQRILLELEGPRSKHPLLPAHFRDGETEAGENPKQGGRMRDALIQLSLLAFRFHLEVSKCVLVQTVDSCAIS